MRRLILVLIVIVAIPVLPWLIMGAYMDSAGVLVTGRVIEKRESFVMPGGDSWKHIFEITYQYQPGDSRYPETGKQRIDELRYRSLRVGSEVQIRYSRSRLLRSMWGIGSFLAGSPALSRLPYGPLELRDFAELTGIAVAALIGFAAYRTNSRSLGLLAAIAGGTCIPVILLAVCGLILFPVLFWGSLRNPGKGYGWALLGIMSLSTAVVYSRIPQPGPMPPAPLRNGAAIVRQIRVVDEIWTNAVERHTDSEGGQDIRSPFQMLDLEFTPEGASESIHVLDRVDLDSVPGLHEGGTLPIYYSAADPHLARAAAGTRNYARQALVYLLALTYGMGAVLAFVVFPAVFLVKKLVRSSRFFGPLIAYCDLVKQLSGLPADDPRRKDFREFIRARQRS